MRAPLARLEGLLARLRRRAEVEHQAALAAEVALHGALATAPPSRAAPVAAGRLQAEEALRMVLVGEASTLAKQVVAKRQALLQASVEHKKIERLLARRRAEEAERSRRQEQATVEAWLRHRRA